MIIAVDFDGTCVTHSYPEIGEDIGAIPVLKELVKNGHQLILFTMRGNKDSMDYLDQAIEWFKLNDIALYGIQTNPTQNQWTNSPKAYAQMYIDDAALGCPLKNDLLLSDRPYVDWERVREILSAKKLI